MFRVIATTALFSAMTLALCSVSSAAPTTDTPLSKQQAAKLLWQDAVDFYSDEIESGEAKEFGVEVDFKVTLSLLLQWEQYLSSDFDLMVLFLTTGEAVTDTRSRAESASSTETWGQLTGSEAFAAQGPLANVYSRRKSINPYFGHTVGYHGLCAKPSVDKANCRVGFGDGTGPAPYCKIPRASGAPQVTGQQCSWISCPGIEGWPDGWSYRCCTLTFVCTQNFFLFDTSYTVSGISLYAAKCD